VLNREQTEEWKGWMQFIFLLYHYFSAHEVYNSVRVMITSYVWMTGFGNFSFFYLKGDYGVVRLLQMLWRLNFLVLLLCMLLGNTYILYYICPLHTFYFLVVYATMRLLPATNYTTAVRFKLLAVAAVIYLIWDLDLGLFEKVFFFLGDSPKIGASSGTMWEWYFRSSLDHWSTFLGMVSAVCMSQVD
jgi:N-acetylneuraminate 9-O-acetyltransferase